MHIAVATGKFLPILVSYFRLDWILRSDKYRSPDVMPQFLKGVPRLRVDAEPSVATDDRVGKRGIKRRDAQAAGTCEKHATVAIFVLYEEGTRPGHRTRTYTVE